MPKTPEDLLNELGSDEHYEPGQCDSAFEQNKKTATSTFKFIAVGELIKNIRPPCWLIDGYLEEHTLACIFGESGAGKSFVAIDMACCIATGTPWHGHNVDYGIVFYIAGEGHNGLAKRFKAWEIENGASLENALLYVAERPAQLCNAENAATIATAVQELSENAGQKPRIIFIDTLARNYGGGDENSTEDMNTFVRHVDEIKNYWQATALIVHHTGHENKGRMRGSSVLRAALDHEYLVTKDGDYINFISKKSKESRDPDSLRFHLATVAIPHSEGNIPLEGAALIKIDGSPQKTGKKLSPQKQRAVDILRNCLIDKGKKQHIQKGMAQVDCVSLDEYREAMRLENIVDSDDPDNVRRRISAIITSLNNEKITGSYGDYIWLPD
jgi:AAA domain